MLIVGDEVWCYMSLVYLMHASSRHYVANGYIVVGLSLKGHGVWTEVEQCDDHECSGVEHGGEVMCAWCKWCSDRGGARYGGPVWDR